MSALAASLLLHAGVGAVIVLALVRPVARAAPHRDRPDLWAGNTLDVEAVFESSAGKRAARRLISGSPRPAASRSPVLHVARAARARAPQKASRLARSRATQKTPRHAPAPIPDRSQHSSASAPASNAVFGAAGVPTALRDLGKAFTRALPRAALGDPLWSKLPLGPAGNVDVVLRIDAGRLVSAKPKHEPLAPQIRHMLERTVLLLRAGQFALSESDAQSGSETLRIEVTLSKGAPSDPLGADPTDAVALGFRAPRRGRPGRAYFTLASGRHIEARVTLNPRSLEK